MGHDGREVIQMIGVGSSQSRSDCKMGNYGILQWNVQGIRNKKNEILEMTERNKVSILCIQETKLAEYIKFRIPGYSIQRQDEPFSHAPHHGVAVFVHSSVPYERIELRTPVQAIAIRARLHNTVTVCNIYAPGLQLLNCQILDDIYRRLPQPVVFLGDFNAYNRLWGSNTTT